MGGADLRRCGAAAAQHGPAVRAATYASGGLFRIVRLR